MVPMSQSTAGPLIKRVVVGVDGSEHSTFALEWAVRVSAAVGSEVIAVFAISPSVYFDTGFGAPTIPIEYDN